jgi:hypothetical protein
MALGISASSCVASAPIPGIPSAHDSPDPTTITKPSVKCSWRSFFVWSGVMAANYASARMASIIPDKNGKHWIKVG